MGKGLSFHAPAAIGGLDVIPSFPGGVFSLANSLLYPS
jgi:hypothetical protein